MVGQVPYSFTLEEDAVVAMLPEIRAGLVRNLAQVLDDIILNADTTTTNNINADGATISTSDAAKAQWLVGFDGIIHLPVVDNTSQSNDHNAAVSDDMFNEIRAKLGKYGARPSELVWVMDVNTFIRAQSISEFRTMDKLGPNATLLTGMLGAIEGIPVIVSEQMKLADTDGKVTDAGNATDTGRLLIFNGTQWAQGFRREMTIDVDRDTQKRQTVVTTAESVAALFSPSGTNVPPKWVQVALSSGAADAFAVAVQNPEAVDVIIVRCILDITTAGGSATSVLDVDVVGGATDTGDDIFDGVDANAAGISDSLNSTDNGTNGEGKSWRWDKNGGTNDYVTAKILVANASSLAGNLYIQYVPTS